MQRIVSLTHAYPVDPDRVWLLATDLDALADCVKGLVSFEGLPVGRIYEGQTIQVNVSLFGKLPAQPYEMHVAVLDNAGRRFLSQEKGAGVRQWDHTLEVVKTASGCELRESILIDAGLMTPLFALWARYLYRKRHPGRLRLLGLPQNEQSAVHS